MLKKKRGNRCIVDSAFKTTMLNFYYVTKHRQRPELAYAKSPRVFCSVRVNALMLKGLNHRDNSRCVLEAYLLTKGLQM